MKKTLFFLILLFGFTLYSMEPEDIQPPLKKAKKEEIENSKKIDIPSLKYLSAITFLKHLLQKPNIYSKGLLGTINQTLPVELIDYIKMIAKTYTNDSGKTLLHLANSTNFVEFLIALGVNRYCLDKFGNTPFLNLLLNDKKNIALKLLDYIDKDFPNSYGQNALQCAIISNNFDLLKKLKEKNLIHINTVTNCKFDRTVPLMFATQHNPEAVKYLIAAGANVNVAMHDGRTALMIAAQCQPEAVKYLIDAGANVNATSNNGRTALMIAAQCQPEAVKYLIDAGANVNATSNNGRTALMIAAQCQPEAVKYLIDAGANVNATSNNGETALTLAAQRQPEAVKYLITAGAR